MSVMFMMTVPDCSKCKTSKNVVFRIADVKEDRTWFNIAYCKKCFSVAECHFQGRRLTMKESRELEKEIKNYKVIEKKDNDPTGELQEA